MRAKAVIDGQLVEIPVLLYIRTVVTQEDNKTGERKYPGKYKVMFLQKTSKTKMKYDAD